MITNSLHFFWRGVDRRQVISRYHYELKERGWLVRHVRSDKAEIFFFAKEERFLMLFQTSTKLTFDHSHCTEWNK